MVAESIAKIFPGSSEAIKLKQLKPINVLPTMSKLLENVVAGLLMNYANEHEIIPKVQCGFRKLHSTTTALMRITNDVTRNIDNSLITYTVSLDYSKASDMGGTTEEVNVDEKSARPIHTLTENEKNNSAQCGVKNKLPGQSDTRGVRVPPNNNKVENNLDGYFQAGALPGG
ncbi:hypothetical protein JTB14_007362 [Gonioctena quinquepunctata]|nr:hypothetical protein JTB14_007362 [Gonioctena quinquepunctata]